MPISLTSRDRRLGLSLLAAGLLATGAAACEPPPPPPAFTVIAAESGADVDPGDGECANADGRCSLQAAVEEANALDTPTDITVGDGTVPAVSLEVTGSIDIVGPGAGEDSLWDVRFTVAEGAKLVVMDASISSAIVHGTFGARRTRIGVNTLSGDDAPDALIDVSAGGRAMLTNTLLVGWGAPAAVNDGVLVLHSTSVHLPDVTFPGVTATGPAVTTGPGADTRLAATGFFVEGAVEDTPAACAGTTPDSYGYNIAPDATCGLDATGDLPNVVETLFGMPLDSARLNAIPAGELECGDGWTDDVNGDGVRPRQSNDPTPACDIGALEY